MLAIRFGIYSFLTTNVYSPSLLLGPKKGTPRLMEEPGLSLLILGLLTWEPDEWAR